MPSYDTLQPFAHHRAGSDLILAGLANLVLIVAAIAGFSVGIWYFAPGGRRAFLGPQRERFVPWSGAELGAAVFLVYLFWPMVAGNVLGATGLFGFDEKKHAPAPENKLVFELCAVLLALPLQLATPLVLFGLISNTQPYQLGITPRGGWRNLVAGVIGCVTFTPPSYFVLGIAGLLVKAIFQVEPEQHRLIRELGSSPSGIYFFLSYVLAAIAAPLVEELLFRGVLQPWFIARRWGGHLAMGAALLMAVVLRMQHYRSAVEKGAGDLLFDLSPALFVLVLLPGYAYLYRRFGGDPSAKHAIPAIYGTALLFAIMHSSAWPQPVALFVLAIGLGLVAYRTQSLVPSIVMHALFNTVAFVLLLFAGEQEDYKENGSEETSAGYLEPAPSTSTCVPVSW